jgi:hypothetical protein
VRARRTDPTRVKLVRVNCTRSMSVTPLGDLMPSRLIVTVRGRHRKTTLPAVGGHYMKQNLRNSRSLAIASLFPLAAAAWVSSPAFAAPPDVIYRFDVISDTPTIGGQPCTPQIPACRPALNTPAPYELGTLELTHEAFAPNHAAQLTVSVPTQSVEDNGVVAFSFVGDMSGPPPTGSQFYSDTTINLTITGDELSGNVFYSDMFAEGCGLRMMSGFDDNWVGVWFCGYLSGGVLHNFTATVTRVPPGVARR